MNVYDVDSTLIVKDLIMTRENEDKATAEKYLTVETLVRVRFGEVDLLKIVWHGNYLKYLEDGREAFGKRYGLEYLYIYSMGYITPIVDLNIKYKNSATIDDVLVVRTTYIPDRAAKLIYRYEIFHKKDHKPVLEAHSIQLFQTLDGQLEVSKPDFLKEWEHKHKL